MSVQDDEITVLLDQVAEGVPGARDALFHRVYRDLRGMAHGEWRRRRVPNSDTLQPTALVHEVYARVFSSDDASWENRRHFFAVASRAMRDILVEQARRHSSKKRGGHMRRVPLSGEEPDEVEVQAEEVLELEEAVAVFEKEHPKPAEVLTLRVFGGLSHSEAANVIGCAEATVRRRWTFAQAWIKSYWESNER